MTHNVHYHFALVCAAFNVAIAVSAHPAAAQATLTGIDLPDVYSKKSSLDLYSLFMSRNGAALVATYDEPGGLHPWRPKSFHWTAATGWQAVDLPDGSTFIEVLDLSADGSVAVGIGNTAQGHRVVRWSLKSGLEILPVPEGAPGFFVARISADGSTIIGTTHGPDRLVLRWTSENDVSIISPPPGGSSGYALAVSADGSVVAGSFEHAYGLHVFRWTSETGSESLGALPEHPSLWAHLISAHGDVIVGQTEYAAGEAGPMFRWTPDTGVQALPRLSEDEFATAVRMNSTGTAVLGWGSGQVRWTLARGAERIEELSPTTFLLLRSLSEDGRRAVGGAEGSEFVAALWTTTLGTVRIDDFLAANGVDIGDWSFTGAVQMSADGRTICGYRSRKLDSGQKETQLWLATLPASCPADFNADGVVSSSDLALFLAEWGNDHEGFDLDEDRIVSAADLALFLGAWGPCAE